MKNKILKFKKVVTWKRNYNEGVFMVFFLSIISFPFSVYGFLSALENFIEPLIFISFSVGVIQTIMGVITGFIIFVDTKRIVEYVEVKQ